MHRKGVLCVLPLHVLCNVIDNVGIYWSEPHEPHTELHEDPILKCVTELSKHHLIPLQKWLDEKTIIQFVGDNVSKRKSVMDIRSENPSKVTPRVQHDSY